MTTYSHARPIRTLLIANRGEIATRIAQVCRGLGIRTVAAYSDADLDAPFVDAADLAVPIGGRTPAESYLDASRLLAAAARAGADAVHPGYGFLAESPEFAQLVLDAGLTWVGPSPEAMRAMALKVRARQLAMEAGVPVVAGAELGDGVDVQGAAASIGYPLLVKASAGGGGRGMRIVSAEADLVEAIESARREAEAAFGDPTVFLERYLESARHVEVQIVGDLHGTVLHVGDRECSVQRRHQKVIEEAPAPHLSPAVRESMRGSAVALARSIGYVGAGTVEFVVVEQADEQTFHFLEMNTRLQVEHPVTEIAFGVPLIEWQLRVAAGEPLPLTQDDIVARCCAVEARLYAEDPAHGFAPSTGRVLRFEVPAHVRVDSAVEAGTEVGTYYDPMLAKVVASAPTREDASRRLAGALRAAVLHGPITNRDSLVAVLESDEFLAGRFTTATLEQRRDLLAPRIPEDRRRLHLAAAVLAATHLERLALAGEPAASTAFAPAAWRNVPAVPQARAFGIADESVTVAYVPERGGRWRMGLTAERVEGVGGADIAWWGHDVAARCALRADGDVEVDLETDERARARVSWGGDGVVTVHDGVWNSRLVALPRFRDPESEVAAGGSATPVPGTVTVVAVAVGDEVAQGQTLVVLEAMKMEHRLVAAADGVVTAVRAEVGQSVEAHEVLVVVE